MEACRKAGPESRLFRSADQKRLLSVLDGLFQVFVLIGILRVGVEVILLERVQKNELLLGKDKKPEDCLDEDGYVSYVLPRLGVLTVILVIYAAFNLYCDLSGNELLPYPLGFIPLAAVLAVLIWYLVSTVKANKRFF